MSSGVLFEWSYRGDKYFFNQTLHTHVMHKQHTNAGEINGFFTFRSFVQSFIVSVFIFLLLTQQITAKKSFFFAFFDFRLITDLFTYLLIIVWERNEERKQRLMPPKHTEKMLILASFHCLPSFRFRFCEQQELIEWRLECVENCSLYSYIGGILLLFEMSYKTKKRFLQSLCSFFFR